MKSFLVGLFGKSGLSPLEKLILDAIRARLDSRVIIWWDRQVATINKVQRLPGGVEVNFYRMQGSKVSFDSAIAFPNKTEELLIAKLTLGFVGTRQHLIAQIWAVNGYVFSIEYDGGAEYFEEALGMDPLPELEVQCELLADLNSPGESAT